MLIEESAEIYRGYAIPSEIIEKLDNDTKNKLINSHLIHAINSYNTQTYIFGNIITILQIGEFYSYDNLISSDKQDLFLMDEARSYFGKNLPHIFPKTYFIYRII